MRNRKILLTENEIPDKWYNIVADMPNKPLPPRSPTSGRRRPALLHGFDDATGAWRNQKDAGVEDYHLTNDSRRAGRVPESV